ncbi:MAG: electron transport complex subunit RsxE [Firmicutes bacterium HGW-Firmicutes-1]|jgi:electron transport complex protein RnfE|nr:MAG: electron transport complex subunit RsxE [Firmicutes bacterium HGW-Firmicutes-1]
MSGLINRLKNGLVTENPTFVQVLGMCPTLAVTTSAINGLGMGLATTAVLMGSNLVISMLRNIIPSKVRIPAFIVVIAVFVTITDMLLQAFVPSLYSALGIFIPLIVVNCVVLGRAEAYASKNGLLNSLWDGLGNGLGFTFSLGVIGIIREIFGSGAAFGKNIMPSFYEPVTILVLAPGAFIVLGLVFALFNFVNSKKTNKA